MTGRSCIRWAALLVLLSWGGGAAVAGTPARVVAVPEVDAQGGAIFRFEADGIDPGAEGAVAIVSLCFRNARLPDASRLVRVRAGGISGELGPLSRRVPPGVYQIRIHVERDGSLPRGTFLGATRVAVGDARDAERESREQLARLRTRMNSVQHAYDQMLVLLEEIASPPPDLDRAAFRARWERAASGWFSALVPARDGFFAEMAGSATVPLRMSNNHFLESTELFRWVIRDKAVPLGLPVPDPDEDLHPMYEKMSPEDREAFLRDFLDRGQRILRDGVPTVEDLAVDIAEAERLLGELDALCAPPPPPPVGDPVPPVTPEPGSEEWWVRWDGEAVALAERLGRYRKSEEFLWSYSTTSLHAALLGERLAGLGAGVRAAREADPEVSPPVGDSTADLRRQVDESLRVVRDRPEERE